MTSTGSTRVPRLTRLVAVIAALCALAAGCSDDSDPADTAADVELWTLEGAPSNLTDFTGEPLVVNFFAESCPPCVAEMPAFDRVARSVEGEVAFLGISADATSAAAVRILDATGITYPALWDRDGSALQHFEAFGLPTTVLLDASGAVVDKHTGELSEDDLRELMADAFGVQ